MKFVFAISLLILGSIKSQTHENDKIYITHGIEHGINHPYGVSELIVKTDSTFTWKTFNVDKDNWENYFNDENVISISGKVLKTNDLYILKEVGSNSKGLNEWIVNITERKIEFYIKKNSELIKTNTEYNRIKTDI